MAAPDSVDPVQLLEKHLASASPDLLREMIASFANAMMSAQADQVCGAGVEQLPHIAGVLIRTRRAHGRPAIATADQQHPIRLAFRRVSDLPAVS